MRITTRMILKEIKIADERMKNSITEEMRTQIPHPISSPALQHV